MDCEIGVAIMVEVSRNTALAEDAGLAFQLWHGWRLRSGVKRSIATS
jgi:hypothetical protein